MALTSAQVDGDGEDGENMGDGDEEMEQDPHDAAES